MFVFKKRLHFFCKTYCDKKAISLIVLDNLPKASIYSYVAPSDITSLYTNWVTMRSVYQSMCSNISTPNKKLVKSKNTFAIQECVKWSIDNKFI